MELYSASMAVPAKNPSSRPLPASPSGEVLSEVQLFAAALYAKGYKTGPIARILYAHIYPKSKLLASGTKEDREKLIKQARMKLRRWRKDDIFLDACYEATLRLVEYDTPTILAAIRKQAKKGELKHAQWLLELTGRYTPKGDQTPGNVTVVFAQGLPRPEATEVEGYEVTDGS